ncbi:ABC transporter permease [Roseibium sp. SCP14]|uniref:ABC transporter permease n=1 Tax=Roseibium sp. SCP14 TaxID=3141375 RepID=UPI003337EFD4
MSKLLKAAYCSVFLLILMMPLFIVFGVSMNAKKVLFFPPRGVSSKWYSELFLNPQWYEPLITSLAVAVLTGLLALSVALPVAYLLWRYGVFYARALFALGLLPFAFPPVITAMGMLLLWVSTGHTGQIENVVIGHAVFLLALPLTMISLGFESISKEVLEAAETMGANRAQVFRTVVLPIITPFLVSSFAFVFVLSMNEFVISFFVGQSRIVTLPVQIFSSLRGGYSPTIASASVLFIMLSFIAFGLIGIFGNLPKLLGAYERQS